MNNPRQYRYQVNSDHLETFMVCYKQSDLLIGIDQDSFRSIFPDLIYRKLINLRELFETHLENHPRFSQGLVPLETPEGTDPVIANLYRLSQQVGVGPLAGIAGCFAQEIGKFITGKLGVKNVIVENGGDIYLHRQETSYVSIFAGKSKSANSFRIAITPELTPCGICTSSGKYGPSKNFGNSDSVTVICRDSIQADLWATALSNKIQSASDISPILKWSERISEILFIAIILDDRIGFRGVCSIFPSQQEVFNHAY